MAYSATVSWTETRTSGRRVLRIRIQESEARDTSEWTTLHTAITNPVTATDGSQGTDVPVYQHGTITLVQSTLVSGTGTTISNTLGKTAAFVADTKNEIMGALSANGFQNSATPIPYSFAPGVKPALYGRSTVNDTTTDHSIDTLIVLVEGHHP